MNIEYNIISVFDFFALIQGILLGIILVFSHRKSRPSLFLGFFLITYSLELVESILENVNILQQYPKLLFSPINFYFLSLPLLYLYTKNLVYGSLQKKDFGVLIPGLLEFLFFSLLFGLPVEKKLSIIAVSSNEFWWSLFTIGVLIFAILFAWWTKQLVSKYQTKISDFRKDNTQHNLGWVYTVANYVIIVHIAFIFAFVSLPFLPEKMSDYIYSAVSILNVIFIYWVGVSGLRQISINIPEKEVPTGEFGDGELKDLEPILEKNAEKSHEDEKEALPDEIVYDSPFQRLKLLMIEQQLFKNPDLTLPMLAKQFLLSRHELSKLINENAGINFNRFVNEYRIEEAKRLLKNSDFDHLNMLGIAEEVGFKSKATFFSTFKKIGGITPGQFKKQAKTA